MACKHSVQRGREGERGTWCETCGVKVYEVETRPCGDCKHFMLDGRVIGICRPKLMTVLSTMPVTYKLTDGTCFEAAA